jgi:hypothetical protein
MLILLFFKVDKWCQLLTRLTNIDSNKRIPEKMPHILEEDDCWQVSPFHVKLCEIFCNEYYYFNFMYLSFLSHYVICVENISFIDYFFNNHLFSEF